MELTAKLLEVEETQQITDSFRKREFVVEYAENPQYPEYVKFELIQDRVDQINEFKPGQEIKVSFNIKGRKWNDPKGGVKYFNSLQAWRIEAAQTQQQSAPANTGGNEVPPPSNEPGWLAADNNNAGGVDVDDDDLPF